MTTETRTASQPQVQGQRGLRPHRTRGGERRRRHIPTRVGVGCWLLGRQGEVAATGSPSTPPNQFFPLFSWLMPLGSGATSSRKPDGPRLAQSDGGGGALTSRP